jgi:hypothetical protein
MIRKALPQHKGRNSAGSSGNKEKIIRVASSASSFLWLFFVQFNKWAFFVFI